MECVPIGRRQPHPLLKKSLGSRMVSSSAETTIKVATTNPAIYSKNFTIFTSDLVKKSKKERQLTSSRVMMKIEGNGQGNGQGN